jgi:zinc transport system substrate-binding protein
MTAMPSPLPRAIASLATLAVCSAVLSGCGTDDDDASAGTQVVASSYPFAYVLERVGGEHVDVQNLTSPGAEPHDLELSPRQLADLSDADLVVYESGFQPAVDDGLEEVDLPADSVLDIADVADPEVTGFSAEHDHGHGEDEHAEDHADEHAEDEHTEDHAEDEHADEHAEDHADEHAEDHADDHADEHADEHAEDELDPHVWLDPIRMQQITAEVEERLAAADPDNAQAYRDNAAAFTRDLEQLDRDFERGLADCERRTIVTGHAAFAYLADRYDLTQVAIAGIDPHAEPTPAQQAEVADLVERDGITTVFTEELAPSAVADSIAEETGVTVARLDPIEGLGDDTADQTYLTLMEANLAAIKEANGCS